MEKIKILFICYGNICRSTMAQSLMVELVARNNLSDYFEINSAGTSAEELGNPMYPPAARTLEAHEIPITPHKATRLTKKDYEQYNLLLCMEEKNVEAVLEITGGDPDQKIHRVLDISPDPRDIPDPWYTGEFEQTFLELTEGCDYLLGSLLFKPEDKTTDD
ncbi:MAG: low molecular weight protein-tyrosine-phosphatase [Eubacteriales bacterium]